MVVGRSAERDFKAGGYGRRSREDAEDRRPQLGDGYAGGAACLLCRAHGGLHPSVTRKSLMQTKAMVLVLGWVGVNWLTNAPAFAVPLPQELEGQSAGIHEKREAEVELKEKPKVRTRASEKGQDFSVTSRHGFNGQGKDFLSDQKQIWTSPLRLRFSDTEWLVPLSGISAGLFVTDSDFSRHLSRDPKTISHYKTLSDVGVAALIGGAGGMWLLGHAKHNDHWSETGFLAGEAALNSLVVVEGLKYSFRRERPFQGDGTGPFFQNAGTSFPSEHAAAAWSVAGVIAHEYPSPFVKTIAYGLASLVDISRVRGHQHFPSDVLIGSVIGNL